MRRRRGDTRSASAPGPVFGPQFSMLESGHYVADQIEAFSSKI